MTRVRARGALFAALLACAVALPAQALEPERQWWLANELFQQGQLEAADKTLRALREAFPNFRLAAWLHGDVLAARASRKPTPPEGAGDITAADLREEAQLRWQARTPPAEGLWPDLVWQLAPSTAALALADLSRARLYLMEQRGGRLWLRRSQFISQGRKGFGKQTQGDLRTPLGLYRITGYMNDAELPELYGVGALPLDYPNDWDRRRQRSGSGIWLHGVPRETLVRAPRSSEGCVTMANDDLLTLHRALPPGAPVLLADRIEWLTPEARDAQRRDLLAAIEDWRAAWSAKNTGRYLSHYAGDFVSEDGMSRAQFVAYKQRVNASKKFIRVGIDDLEALRVPGEDGVVRVRFRQDYRSDNLGAVSRKQQYWRRNPDGRWKIVTESSS